MSRIWFMSPYLKGGRDSVKRFNRVRYLATRSGVEVLPDERGDLPATKKQQDYIRRLADSFPTWAREAQLLCHHDFMLYKNTAVTYFDCGEAFFKDLLERVDRAEHFVFLEYFIIQEGKMWNSILEVLEQKAKEGVDVRLIYDDFGCLMTLPKNYNRVLEKKGIRCCVFNPFVPVLSLKFNNRDHRKICVIDGWVGFTGGINLADEYINAYEKHGHWKDTAVMLKGDGVWGLTAMFLPLWDYLRGTHSDPAQYRL